MAAHSIDARVSDYCEVHNNRADQNKLAGLEKSATK